MVKCTAHNGCVIGSNPIEFKVKMDGDVCSNCIIRAREFDPSSE